MSRIRKIAIAGGTFGVALSIGFVMQNGDAMAARFGTEVPTIEGDIGAGPAVPPVETPPAMAGLSRGTPEQLAQTDAVAAPDAAGVEAAMPDAADAAPEALAAAPEPDSLPAIRFVQAPPAAEAPPVPAPATEAPTLAEAPAAATTADAPAWPGVDTGGGVQIAALVSGLASRATDMIPIPDFAPDPDLAPVPAAAPAAPQGDQCPTLLDAQPGRAATVVLEISAPCLPEAQVTVHHQGMMFTLLTDAEGRATATVPALSDNAVFIASFEEGAGAVATVAVPSMANYDRAVLQWQGEAVLQIHAREFGADYGTDGHVWLAAARSEDSAVAGEGGFLTRLGDGAGPAPLFAEVYTFPSATYRLGGEVMLTVEAEITEATCGREVTAQSIQVAPGAPAKALDLTMTLPECDAVGDFLVLNNMLEDLTLAAR